MIFSYVYVYNVIFFLFSFQAICGAYLVFSVFFIAGGGYNLAASRTACIISSLFQPFASPFPVSDGASVTTPLLELLYHGNLDGFHPYHDDSRVGAREFFVPGLIERPAPTKLTCYTRFGPPLFKAFHFFLDQNGKYFYPLEKYGSGVLSIPPDSHLPLTCHCPYCKLPMSTSL